MSSQGIKLTAKVFEFMQMTRGELFELAHKHGIGTESGKQDLLLGQMLDTAKDAISETFARIIEKHRDHPKNLSPTSPPRSSSPQHLHLMGALFSHKEPV